MIENSRREKMGKKYLDTKKGSLEQSVLGIWQTAIEEGDARVDGRTKGYKEHRSKLEASRIRRENKKKSMNEDQGFTDEELDEISDEEFDIFEMSDEMFEATMKKKSAGDRKAAAKKRAKWMKTSGGKKALMKAKKRAAKVRKGQIKVDPKRAKQAKKRAKLYSGDNLGEASGDKEAYKKFFNAALKKFGIDSPADLKSDEEKKKFYDYVDKNWEGDNEKKEEVELNEFILETLAAVWFANTALPLIIGGGLLAIGGTGLGLMKLIGKIKEIRKLYKDKKMQKFIKDHKGEKKLDAAAKSELDKLVPSSTKKKIKDDFKDAVKKEEVNESIDWTNSYNREWGTDELRKHTEDVTPGQEGEWSEAVNAKNQTMREALAKVWGFDEGKSPFQNEDKKGGKTLTGKKVASIDINPTIKEKTK